MHTFLLRRLLWIVLATPLAACSPREDEQDAGGDKGEKRTQAEQALIGELRHAPGATVFIAHLSFSLRNYADLAGISYSVAPRPGSHSKPLAVSFDKSWLDRRGAWQSGSGRLELPVFGLYAAHANEVSLSASFRDGSTHACRATIPTTAYSGPAGVYAAPAINLARSPERVPGFDFVLIKNGLSSPVVIDTDGHMRWTGAALGDSFTSMFGGDTFFIGDQGQRVLYRMGLDGAYTAVPVADPKYTGFHHDLSPGKTGMLAELNALEGGVLRFESILAEIDANGKVLKEWDLGRIFSAYMRSKGDDPANFVREGLDWFHMNSAIYHAADNSLLVSSRENFVVKLDYDTGAIRWLFGDTGKHWYVNYPSLRALALKLEAGKAPIGQHSLSVTPDGQLLLFNNGLGSLNQPAGAPPGLTRGYSAPSRYAIDDRARTAREVWTYERGRDRGGEPLFSDICSSVYEATPGKYLVAYSSAAARTSARLLGVDSQGKLAFDFGYPAAICDTVFIAEQLAWSDLKLC
ncbi:aryl-sulfate sulfotransferase [Massilia alkalitolerans]|uniref:aryl-sulfate sulfotransferase n=1 Tax=Massilia alkalitolerans TaxID=286638 RepID=UPI0028AD0F23|nr:aryl-sulfate sulfotransferase [Massilia alkalitolerans]